MAKNRPVKICVARHRPSKEPKFHHPEILMGVGKSINAPLAILIIGCDFRIVIIFFFNFVD